MTKALRSQLLLNAALLIACVLVVILGLRQIAVNRAYANLRRQSVQPHEGYVVPAFPARTLAGDTLTIGESVNPGGGQVLFVFTTTCQFCRATLPVWASLADSLVRLNGGRIQVVALSLDSVDQSRRYASEHRLGYPVATFPTGKLRRLYRAGSVPQTVVLDAWGVVRYAYVGQLGPGPVLDSVYRAVTGLIRMETSGSSPGSGSTTAGVSSRSYGGAGVVQRSSITGGAQCPGGS
jgi:peroxiredoxin